MVTGISHVTLIVRDIEKTARLFEDALGARRVYESGEKGLSIAREMFLMLGDLWLCVMEGELHEKRTYDHIAFSVPEADFEKCLARIKAAGAEIRPDRPRVQGEGRSAYFYDYDNHLFEIHAGTLLERLDRYAR